MLARLARSLPTGDYLYEPKWDGFRCLARRIDDDIDLRSRNDRPMARYFPELARALAALGPRSFWLDGEILAVDERGTYDFSALMTRLHPAASRVDMLARETPATYMVFDVLMVDDEDLTGLPFVERRHILEAIAGQAAASPVVVTPATADANVAAEWLASSPRPGIDGVVAKARTLVYTPGSRTMTKVKRERTADCVVAGLRATLDGAPAVASLLLGVYDRDGALRHIGVCASFRKPERVALLRELFPLRVPLEEHPWRNGFALEGGPTGRLRGAGGRWAPGMSLDWVPLAPVRVCEVAYDQRDGIRLRHPARFRHWRPDRDPASCTLDQFDADEAA